MNLNREQAGQNCQGYQNVSIPVTNYYQSDRQSMNVVYVNLCFQGL